MKKISIILIGLTLIGVKAQKNSTPPNIVMILADDLGYECINSYGGTSYNTPHLTQLAQTGMRNRHKAKPIAYDPAFSRRYLDSCLTRKLRPIKLLPHCSIIMLFLRMIPFTLCTCC